MPSGFDTYKAFGNKMFNNLAKIITMDLKASSQDL